MSRLCEEISGLPAAGHRPQQLFFTAAAGRAHSELRNVAPGGHKERVQVTAVLKT